MPVPAPIVTFVLLLLHVPPRSELVKLVVAPIHTDGMPAIGAGSASTVTILVAAIVPQLLVTV